MKVVQLFILFLFIISCSKKQGPSTQTQLVLSGLVAGQVGGIMVYGDKLDGPEAFSMALSGPGQTIILPSGNWRFLVLSWEGDAAIPVVPQGNRNMTGRTRCDYKPIVDISGADATVNFFLSTSKCIDTLPDGTQMNTAGFEDASGWYQKLNIYTCIDDTNTLGTFQSGCVSGMPTQGLAQSVQISLPGFMEPSYSPLPSLVSRCIDLSTAPDPNVAETLVRLPVGMAGGANDSGPVHPVITLFPEPSCAGNPVTYNFDNTLINFTSNPLGLTSNLVDTSDITELAVEYGPLTVENFGQPSLFGYGTTAGGTIASPVANDYSAITDFSADGYVISLTATNGANFAPGEEILWYVNEMDTPGDCGDLNQGLFGFARIASITGDDLTLEKSVKDYKTINGTVHSFSTLPNNASLTQTVGMSGFCSMQIVYVPNYNNIAMAGGNPIPVVYSRANRKGGIFAFKVNGTLDSQSTGPLTISSYQMGDPAYVRPVPHTDCVIGSRDCAFFGSGNGQSSGGIVIAAVKNLNLGDNFIIDVKGANMASVGAGDIVLVNDSITGAASATFDAAGAAGIGGSIRFTHCIANASVAPTLDTSGSTAAGPAPYVTTTFCP